MKAELTLAELRSILRALSPLAVPAVRSRYAPDPVLGINVDGPTVTITAGTAAVSGRITATGGTADGHTVVDVAQLAAAVSAVAPARTRSSAVVTLAAEPGHLHLTGATTITLPTRTPAAVLAIPDHAEQQVLLRLPAGVWIRALSAVAKAASRKGSDATTGIRLHRQPGCCLDIEATDRMRAHRIVVGQPSDGPHESWLSAATVKLLTRALGIGDPAEQVTIGYANNTLVCATGTLTLAANAVASSSWPDVQRVLETSIEPGHTFTAATAGLREAIRAARAIADPKNPCIDLEVDPQDMTVIVTVPGRDRPLFTTAVAVTAVRGGRLRCIIRADHATDLLAAITTEQATVTVPEGRHLLGVTAGRVHGALIRYTRDQTARW